MSFLATVNVAKNICVQVSVWINVCSFCVNLGVELLDHRVLLCLAFSETELFSQIAAPFNRKGDWYTFFEIMNMLI